MAPHLSARALTEEYPETDPPHIISQMQQLCRCFCFIFHFIKVVYYGNLAHLKRCRIKIT